MVPALAHKGVYRWRCCVKGHAAHSSLTPQAVNAVEVGARVIGKLADMSERWRDHEPRYAGFDVPYSTGAVCVVEGGIADNVVPEDCRFHYEFRNLPNADVAAMQREVEAYARASNRRCVRSIRGRHPFRVDLRDAGFLARPDDPAVRLAQRLAATDATTLVAFGTEAGLFQGAGIPTVVCGPGHIAQAHQADEYVSLAQLAAAERFLLALDVGGAGGRVGRPARASLALGASAPPPSPVGTSPELWCRMLALVLALEQRHQLGAAPPRAALGGRVEGVHGGAVVVPERVDELRRGAVEVELKVSRSQAIASAAMPAAPKRSRRGGRRPRSSG